MSYVQAPSYARIMRAPVLYRPEPTGNQQNAAPAGGQPAATAGNTNSGSASSAGSVTAATATSQPVAATTTIQKPPSSQAQQQQQVSAPPALGGQRMALKLAKPVPPAALWPAQSQQLAYQHHQQSPCNTLDCDQLSDCSCSNSLECLSQQQQHQPQHLQLHHLDLQSVAAHHNSHHSYPFQSPFPVHQQQQNPQPLHLIQHEDFMHSRSFHHNHIPHQPHRMNQQQQHRPLIANASVPLPPNSAASLPPPPPPPPPLIRQSTYTATQETITDASLQAASDMSQQQQQQQFNQQHRPQPAGWRDPNKSGSGGKQYQAATLSRLDSAGQAKQRQTVSFRRSATANNQDHSASTSDLIQRSSFDDEQLLDQHQDAAGEHEAAEQRPKSRNRLRLNTNSSSQVEQAKQRQAAAAQHGVCSAPVAGLISGQQQQFQAGQIGAPVATYQPPMQVAQARQAAATTNSTSLLLGAGHSTFDTSQFTIPAISSHRTNSPWMRISSIILTPIGIVIILFIVVSPLLHYLM